jgi:hypothetical protein
MTFSVTLNFFIILPTKTDTVVAFPQIKENPYSSFVNLTDVGENKNGECGNAGTYGVELWCGFGVNVDGDAGKSQKKKNGLHFQWIFY